MKFQQMTARVVGTNDLDHKTWFSDCTEVLL